MGEIGWRGTELPAEGLVGLLWQELETAGVEVGRRRVVGLRDVSTEFAVDWMWKGVAKRIRLKLSSWGDGWMGCHE